MSNRPFEIGLVGAGAISAGAYTAGVIDFMVYALDQWYEAKSKGEKVPTHDVKISVFAGASAGAVAATLGAGYLGSNQPPVPDREAGNANQGRNKLFDSWVDRADISSLLGRKDLADDKTPVNSLLDSTVLRDIANTGLAVTPRAQKRAYVADNLELVLTVTNLRGLPYSLQLLGAGAASYDMSLHADYMHFRISDQSPPSADRYTLKWQEFGTGSPGVELLKTSALASGAFPVGLAPRLLQHTLPGNGNPDYYSNRMWPMATPRSQNPHQCVTWQSIPVNWGALAANYTYEFQCVDGGVMNNEPFEIARRLLAGARNQNPRDGDAADKAILLIDPFPSTSSFENVYKAPPDLLQGLMKLFAALKNQARFKPDELELALDPDVFSRFMIAPRRDGATYAIACGALGGFGGFLKRDFRIHDYFLGRVNAQKFLRDWFVLPESNPLFGIWIGDPGMVNEYCVKDGNTGSTPKLDKQGKRLLPIIPLVGDARQRCYQDPWPEYTRQDLEHLASQLDDRIDIVVDRLVEQYFKLNNFFVRFGAKLIIGRKKKQMRERTLEFITQNLVKMQLMRSS